MRCKMAISWAVGQLLFWLGLTTQTPGDDHLRDILQYSGFDQIFEIAPEK